MEVLAECLVLDMVPAYADPQPQAAPGQDVDLGRLLGDQRGLALGGYQDARYELDPLREAGQVPEEHHGLVEHVGVPVRAVPTRAAAGVGAEHVVVDEQVLVTHILDGLGVVFDRRRVGAYLGLGEDHSDTHGLYYTRHRGGLAAQHIDAPTGRRPRRAHAIRAGRRLPAGPLPWRPPAWTGRRGP